MGLLQPALQLLKQKQYAYTLEPSISDHSKCKEFMIAYWRRLLRVELQEDFYE